MERCLSCFLPWRSLRRVNSPASRYFTESRLLRQLEPLGMFPVVLPELLRALPSGGIQSGESNGTMGRIRSVWPRRCVCGVS